MICVEQETNHSGRGCSTYTFQFRQEMALLLAGYMDHHVTSAGCNEGYWTTRWQDHRSGQSPLRMLRRRNYPGDVVSSSLGPWVKESRVSQ
jgi:hypothetical protein